MIGRRIPFKMENLFRIQTSFEEQEVNRKQKKKKQKKKNEKKKHWEKRKWLTTLTRNGNEKTKSQIKAKLPENEAGSETTG